jgi:hypothetical protein
MQFHTKYLHLQSTTVYFPFSELGLPQPLSRKRVRLPPLNQRVGGTPATGGRIGESQFRRLEKKLSSLPTLCNLNWDLRPAVLLPAAASASSLAQQRHVHLTLQVDDHVLLLLLLGQEERSS